MIHFPLVIECCTGSKQYGHSAFLLYLVHRISRVKQPRRNERWDVTLCRLDVSETLRTSETLLVFTVFLCIVSFKYMYVYLFLISPVVSYGAEAWTLTKREKQALLIFERKIFRRI